MLFPIVCLKTQIIDLSNSVRGNKILSTVTFGLIGLALGDTLWYLLSVVLLTRIGSSESSSIIKGEPGGVIVSPVGESKGG